MQKKILIFNLLFVLAFQPVAATMLVPAVLTDQTGTVSPLTHSKHCPDRATPDCAYMQGCFVSGHSNCDAKITSLLYVSLFDTAVLRNVPPVKVSNHYSLIPLGPPLRPPRYS